MSISGKRVVFCLIAGLVFIPAARAQFAVIDVASVTQLMSQVQTLEQQLEIARADLAQVQSAYQSTIGHRGMEQLLAGTNRNYLPADWNGLQRASQGAPGVYPALSADMSRSLTTNSILSTQQLASLSPAASQQLAADRQTVAMMQAVSHQALATTSMRFASLQQLIDAITRANDQKSVLDLHARIAVETGMLQNEQTKLQTLSQSLQAERWANEQRAREQAIAGHGQFATRFQPKP